MEVNNNNIEEQILLYVDGELNTEEAGSLLQYIALHPEWRTLLEEYRSLVMQPDTSLVFADKEALLQPEGGLSRTFKKRNSFNMLRWAAAATVVIGAVSLTWMLGRKAQEGVALPRTQTVALQPKPALPAITMPNARTGQPVNPLPATNFVPVPKSVTPVLAQAPKKVQQGLIPGTQRPAVELEPIEGSTPAITGTKDQPQAIAMQRPETLQQEVPEQAVAINTETLPGWLPVSGERLQGVNDLVSHIREVKERVAAKALEIRKSTFVLRFGEKEIAIGK